MYLYFKCSPACGEIRNKLKKLGREAKITGNIKKKDNTKITELIKILKGGQM